MGLFDDLDFDPPDADRHKRVTGSHRRVLMCKRGHTWVPGSYRITAHGGKRCLICKREYEKRKYAKRKVSSARAAGDV